MIECKIIHATPEDSSRGSVRPSENYTKRRNFLLENTIPCLRSMNIEASFFNAIMYSDLVFDRDLEHKTHTPKKQIQHKNNIFLIDNPFPSAYEIALMIGHFSLWNYCSSNDKSLLILEDDVLIKEECKQNIILSFHSFLKIESPSILYLQSTDPCTPNPKTKLKQYPIQNLTKCDNLYRVNNKHSNWSGTAAYMINPAAAKKLTDRANTLGLKCSDGFIHRAINENCIDAYIPHNYEQAILLHPEHA